MATASTKPAATTSDTEAPVWSPYAAHARMVSGEPLTEVDKAYFWWAKLADQMAYRAALALERLKSKVDLAEPYMWLMTESFDDLITYPPVDEYKAVGRTYIDELSAGDVKRPADRAAAQYLVNYAELVDLTDDFTGCWRSDPNPLRPVESARCMWLCERLGSLKEVFCPEQGGLDPDAAERLSEGRRKGADRQKDKADVWRKPVLKMAADIRAKHQDWGDRTIAEMILATDKDGSRHLPSEAISALGPNSVRAFEKVEKCIATAGARGLLPRSTNHPANQSSATSS